MENNNQNNWDSGTIIRGLITIIVLVGCFILQATQNDVPDYLKVIAGSIIGYFFGKQDTSDTHTVIKALNTTTNILLFFLLSYSIFD